MKAVIQTGGKQYLVSEGDKIHIEKLEAEVGSKITFDDVLLKADGAKVELGSPKVAGAKVEGTVRDQYKDDKVLIIKHKRRKRYMRRQGHRQKKTVVEITKI